MKLQKSNAVRAVTLRWRFILLIMTDREGGSVFGDHKIFNVFDFRNFERGDVTLPFVTVFTLVGIAGVGYLVDRSTTSAN